MIPFSLSLYPLLIAFIVLFGLPFVLGWFIWLIRLKTSPTVRQNLGSKRTLMILLSVISLLWLFGVIESYRMHKIAQRVRDEIDTEEQIRTPTLTQETTLAGITMPAGTKLELLHKGAVGEQWVKPDYFEYATFPKPILWQGVEIVAMRRFLDTKQDNDYFSCTAKHPEYDWKQCSELSSYETTRILWTMVETTLAKPIKIGQFYCQGEVGFGLAPDETGKVPDIDAGQPVKDFVMSDECRTLAKGNVVSTENGFFSLELAENSSSRKATFGDGVDRKLWTISVYDGVWTGDLFTLYRTNNHSVSLNSDTFHLAEFGGEILSSTPDCPLTKNSYVEWHKDRADTLTVFTDTPIGHCGKFKLAYLDAHPDPEYAEFLKQTTKDR